jgi:hypothetical protein
LAYSFFGADQSILEKISRMGLLLTSLFMILFIIEYTGVLRKRRWVKIVIAAPTAIGVSVLFFQNSLMGVQQAFGFLTLYTPDSFGH